MSNSSLVSGLSEASGARFSWVEVSQESQKNENENLPIKGLLRAHQHQHQYYPVVIITWVHCLGPPQDLLLPIDSEGILEVLREFLGRARGGESI